MKKGEVKVKCIVCRNTFPHRINFKARTCSNKQCGFTWRDIHVNRKNRELRNIKAIRRMFTGQLERYCLTS